MDKKTKKILMYIGVGVAVFILYRMMTKKPTSQTVPQETGTSAVITPPEEGTFDALDYAKNQFGVDDIQAEKIVSKANVILNQTESDWYKHTQKRAGEEKREIPQQAIHEAWWHINTPNRMLEYVENEWGLNGEESQEIIEYVEEKIKTNATWVSDIEKQAEEEGTSTEKMFLRASHWQLYLTDNAKYKGSETIG